MFTFIASLWAIILPKRSTALIVSKTTIEDLRKLVQPVVTPNWIALLPYKHPAVRACVVEAKFYDNKHAQKLLHGIIAHYLTTHQKTALLLVPVPLSAQRLRERGHNQVTSILTGGTKISNPIEPLLERPQHTPPQANLSRQERIKNMETRAVFKLKSSPPIKQLIICDDVVTTGATLGAAKRAVLTSKNYSVLCLAIAH